MAPEDWSPFVRPGITRLYQASKKVDWYNDTTWYNDTAACTLMGCGWTRALRIGGEVSAVWVIWAAAKTQCQWRRVRDGIPWLSVAWLLIADDCWSFEQNLDNNWLQEIWGILCQGCRLVTPMIGFKTALAFCRIVHVQHKVFDWIDLNRAFARTGSRHFTQNVYINVL